MADLLLRGARLQGRDAPVDVAVRQGVVVSVAPSIAAEHAEVLECEGRLLLPGLWDEHVHVTQAAVAARALQLGSTGSAAQAAGAVADSSVAEPGDGLLLGIGFRDGVWPDLPTRAALDGATDRPVVLLSHDLHCVWLNTAAGRLFNAEVPESGLLVEDAAFAVSSRARDLLAERSDDDVLALGRAAAGRGVVGVVDFEMAWNPGEWRRRFAGGFDAVRVEASVYPRDLDRAATEGLRTGAVLGSELLTVGYLKVLIDGSLNTRTAYCHDPYPDGTTGLATMTQHDLEVLLRRAVAAGLRPAVHAIGDAAVSTVLDAYAAVGAGGRMEHAQLVADRDLARFAKLGVVASVQPGHLLDDRDVADRHWPGRTGRAFPFRSLLDAGAALAFGSDAPVAPLDPWTTIRAAVHRAPAGVPWHPEQRITADEALAASTRGRLRPAPGDAADLVLVEEPVERMHAGAVAATLVAGRFTHRPA
jgi:hypothetical protein